MKQVGFKPGLRVKKLRLTRVMNQLLSSEKDNVTGVGRDESQMRGLK